MGKNGVDRRDFIRGMSAAGVAAGLLGMSERKAAAYPSPRGQSHVPPVIHNELLPPPKVSGAPGSEPFWASVREAFILPRNYIHMNTGTTGSQPFFSINNLAVYNLYKSVDPRDWSANIAADFPELFQAMGDRQAFIANTYGGAAEEFVLEYDTTDGLNIIFSGIPWNPGDRIVTTQLEHNAGNGPMARVRDFLGVNLQIVDIPSNFVDTITVPQLLSWFEPLLMASLPAGNKQYLFFSEITYKNGLRLPVKELTALARHYGAYVIIDSAHAWGMLPVNVHDYGIDFMAGAGHKWLCGGPGTGILYVRNTGGTLPQFSMVNASYGNMFVAPSPNFVRGWKPSSLMQGRGESNVCALYAMADSLKLFAQVGVDPIYHRGVALGNYLKDKVAEKWGKQALSVQKNPDPAFHTFLTAVNPFKGKDDPAQFTAMNTAISKILTTLASEDPKIYIRSITWRDKHTDPADNRVAFRISTHAMYNNYEQVDHMFERLVAAVNASGLPQLG